MFADQFRPNTIEEKHNAILDELHRRINYEARCARMGYGEEHKQEIDHLQRQIKFHRDIISQSLD